MGRCRSGTAWPELVRTRWCFCTGWLGTQANGTGLRRRCSQSVPRSECTTIALDQRGHGTSTRVPPDTSRKAFVADVTAVIEHAVCPQPVTLVGQSMGAHTALLTAAWRPDLVARLVMVEGDVGGGGVVAARNVHHALAAWPDLFDSYEQARDFFGGDTERGRAWVQAYEHHSSGW